MPPILIASLDTNRKTRYSVTNTKCYPIIILNKIYRDFRFIVLQFLSLIKWFFIHIAIIQYNILLQVANKRR
jgi:hypothetical protein